MFSGREASSSARRMLAIRRVFCTLSRRPSPVPKNRSRALSLNDRITSQCKSSVYICQGLPYTPTGGGDAALQGAFVQKAIAESRKRRHYTPNLENRIDPRAAISLNPLRT